MLFYSFYPSSTEVASFFQDPTMKKKTLFSPICEQKYISHFFHVKKKCSGICRNQCLYWQLCSNRAPRLGLLLGIHDSLIKYSYRQHRKYKQNRVPSKPWCPRAQTPFHVTLTKWHLGILLHSSTLALLFLFLCAPFPKNSPESIYWSQTQILKNAQVRWAHCTPSSLSSRHAIGNTNGQFFCCGPQKGRLFPKTEPIVEGHGLLNTRIWI